MLSLVEAVIVDKDSRVDFKTGDVVVLTRDYNGHKCGTHFIVTDLVKCSSGDYLRFNARVVYLDEPKDDSFFWRTLPAEYLRRVPKIGELSYFDINQGDRPARCQAVLGAEALWEYEMPAGRTFLRIETIGGGSRSVSRKALPKKWLRELEEG